MTRTLNSRASSRQQARDDQGFTLIELLVVVVIIGVLIAIAVPLYSNYKKGAQNTAASSDVRGGISAVEQFYTSNSNTYPVSAHSSAAGSNVSLVLSGSTSTAGTDAITVSSGNIVYYTNRTSYYVICGRYGTTGTIYTYNSSISKSVSKSTAASISACASATTTI